MIVLDASALLAFLFVEPGHARVAEVLSSSCMSSVNFSEVLARFSRDGKDAGVVAARLLTGPIEIVPFDEAHALRAAELAPYTRNEGLGLGDRACLALAAMRGTVALTADRAWGNLAIGVQVELIRE